MKNQVHNNRKRSRFGSKLLIGLWTAAVVVLLIIGGMAYGGYRVTYSRTNLPNLTLDGIAVGGLTETETVQLLKKENWDRLKDQPLRVDFPLNLSMVLDRMQAGACMTAEEAARQVFRYGHGENWFDNFTAYLHAKFSASLPIQLEEKQLDENYIRANIHSIAEHFRTETADGDLHLNTADACMTMIKGGSVIDLNEEEIYRSVVVALQNGQETMLWTEISGSLNLPDFGKVYEDLAVEAKDAEYNERYEVIPEIIGCSFQVAEAEKIWRDAMPGSKIEIPLEITVPEITGEELESRLYRDRLCFMTTYYGGSTDNRVNNIHLAADKLDGIILYPGDIFSYNETVGQRTTVELY